LGEKKAAVCASHQRKSVFEKRRVSSLARSDQMKGGGREGDIYIAEPERRALSSEWYKAPDLRLKETIRSCAQREKGNQQSRGFVGATKGTASKANDLRLKKHRGSA